MALLKDSDQEHQNLLSLELDLLGLETYVNQTSEGWLKYSLTLRRKEEIVAQINGTLHDNDLRSIENMFSKLQRAELEPLELDFQLEMQPLEDDEYALTCMINHGASVDGVYGSSAVGIRLVITRTAAEKFANELKSERISLTKGMEFKDYETRPLPEN